MAGAKLGDLGGGGWCMERRGSSGTASTSGNAPGAVLAYSLEELCHANGRPDISPPRPARPPPLLTRRRGLQLAACLGLALMTLFWIWAWYPHGDAAGHTGGTMRGQKGRPGVFRTFRIRVKETIAGGRGRQYMQDLHKCPLHYERIPYKDIRERRALPYLLGGRQRPACRNCDSAEPWSRFCSWDYSQFSRFRGPVCPEWLQEQLLSWLIDGAEAGRPGFKEMLTLTPCDIFPLLRGRTLWLMGDSMMQEFMKAMMCFLVEFWDVSRLPQPPIKPMSEPYIDFEWPLAGWCIHLPQDSRVCLLRANTADQMLENFFPAFPRLGVQLDDIVVVNFAMWMNTDDQYHGNMTRFREHVWYHLRDLPLMVWRDSSVQHFDTTSGDYVWPPRSNSCVPFRQVALDDNNMLRTWEPAMQATVEGGWRNKLAYLGLADLQMPIIHTWNVSLNMWNYHTNYREEPGDCTHMCHPSAYQYWIYALYKSLKALPPDARASAQRHLMRPQP